MYLGNICISHVNESLKKKIYIKNPFTQEFSLLSFNFTLNFRYATLRWKGDIVKAVY